MTPESWGISSGISEGLTSGTDAVVPGRDEIPLLRGKGFPGDAFDRVGENLIEVLTELVNGFDTFRTVFEKGLSLFGGDCLQRVLSGTT